MEGLKDKLPGALEKYLKNAPVSENCPLADTSIRPDWNCGKLSRGNETRCKSISGYSRCPHYIKWFYWNLLRMVSKEIAKAEISQKKKNQKENVK